MIMGWFTQTATFVIFNKVCTSQVCTTYYLLVTWICSEFDGPSITVLPLVSVIPTAPYPSAFDVVAVDYQVSRMLDGDTSIVAQPGVPSRVFGGAYLPSSVDLQYRLCCWAQLGARGNRQQLWSPENENTVLTVTTHCLINPMFIHLTPHYSGLNLCHAFLGNLQRSHSLSSAQLF